MINLLKSKFIPVAAVVAAMSIGLPVLAAQPTLLKDISKGHYELNVKGATSTHLYTSAGTTFALKASGEPATQLLPKEIDGEFVSLGSIALFGYNDDIHGLELWRSDGTRTGTYLVKDLVNGPLSGGPRTFVKWRGKVYFTTSSKTYIGDPNYPATPQLWSTDGTAEGTRLITDIDTTRWTGEGEDRRAAYGTIVKLIAGQNELFFNVDLTDSYFGFQDVTLWRSDGTASGTVKMSNPESTTPVFATDLLQSINGVTLFADNQPFWSNYVYDWEIGKLWRMNEAANSLTVLTNGLASPTVASFNGRTYFLTRGEQGLYLARTSEDANSIETVALLYPVDSLRSSINVNFAASATSLFIGMSNDEWAGPINAIWHLSQAKPIPTKAVDLTNAVGVDNLAMKGDILYFSNGSAENLELWRSDGTVTGTHLYRDLHLTGSSRPQLQLFFAGEIWFTANVGSSRNLFRTQVNDSLVKVDTDTLLPTGSQPHQFTTLRNGKTLFKERDGMHATQGTPETTINAGVYFAKCWSCYSLPLLPVGNGAILFSAAGGPLKYTDGAGQVNWVHGLYLWPDSINDFPVTRHSLAPLNANAALFFVIERNNSDLTYSRNLWRSNGSSIGTTFVKQFPLAIPPSTFVSLLGMEALVPHKGLAYFMGNDVQHGNELWRTDGTDAGTYMVKDLVPGNTNGLIGNITSARNQVYFSYTHEEGLYLAKSRGSEKDTMRIATLRGNVKSIQNATSVNDSLFFRAGSALYRSNGQRGDLRRLGHFAFNSVAEASYYRELPSTVSLSAAMTAYGDHLYFVSRKGAKDPLQVWRADTKKNKAEIVTPQFRVQASGANDMSFAVHAGRLFLAVMDRAGQNGGIFELRTSGKTMQWVRHTNMSARELRIASGKMYFAGLDDQYGEEPRVMPMPKRP